MKTYFFILLTYILTVSCSESSEKGIPLSSISMMKNLTETISANEIFDEFKYISLESSEQSLFGQIDKLIVHDNKFFILDKAITKKIFVFSTKGKFIRTIGKIGKGPGEYTHIEDFTIDEETNNIIVLSSPSTVISYDYTGKYISQKKISSSVLFWNISSYKNGFICSSNHLSEPEEGKDFLIYIYDKDFNLRNRALEVFPLRVGMPPIIPNPLLKIGNKNIAYFDFFTSMIYLNVNNTNLKSFHFDFEGKEVPIEFYANPQDFYSKQGKYCFFIDAIFADNELLSTFANKGRQNLLRIDFNTNKKTTFKIKGWFPKLLFYKNKNMYSFMSPSRIKKGHNFFHAQEIIKYPINASSNPVILSFKLKHIK